MKSGFTLLELLLYVSLIGIMISALIPFAWVSVQAAAKNAVQQEVYANTRFISERIRYEIRNATTITSVTPSSITLGATVIDLVGGKVRLNGTNLNSADTTVTNLVFTQSGGLITFTLTVTYAGSASRSEYQASANLRTGAVIRLN